MPVTNIDRLEAMLAAVCPSDLSALSPAERRRLADAAYRVHVVAEQAAGGRPYPAARRWEHKAGVLARLQDGERSP